MIKKIFNLLSLTHILTFIIIQNVRCQTIIQNDFIQSGWFEITDTSTHIIQFTKSFSQIPKLILSTYDLECEKHKTEMDYDVTYSNVQTTGFTVQLTFSSSSNIPVVQMYYIASEMTNIYSLVKKYLMTDFLFNEDTLHKNYNLNIPYSQISLLNSNPSMQVKIIGYFTGFKSQQQLTSSNELIVSMSFSIKYIDKTQFQVQIKELIAQKGQLVEVRFNYFEYYYYENSAQQFIVYEETNFNRITDPNNCLISCGDYTILPPICVTGLNETEYKTYKGRAQSIPSLIPVRHAINTDFIIGLSQIEMDLQVENGRLKYYNYNVDINNNLNITYYTWQHTKVLGVSSTIGEFYNLICPTDTNGNQLYYSFKTKKCELNCESSTYQEMNNSNQTLLPTCNSCDISCLECSGSKQYCLICSSQYPYQLFPSMLCQQAQPQKYYCDKTILPNQQKPDYQYNCFKCDDSLCLTCSSIQKNACLLCSSPAFQYNGSCYSIQPDNTVCNSQNQCELKCNQKSCQKCIIQSTCETCLPTYSKNSVTLQCYCLPGQFEDQNSIQCKNCMQSCSTCENINSCQTCSPSFPFYILQTHLCQSTPPTQNYFCQKQNISPSAIQMNDQTNRILQTIIPDYQYNCDLCSDSLCLKCSSLNQNSCIQCIDSAYLYKGSCSFNQPEKTVCNLNRICEECTLDYCKVCINQTTCSECSSNFQVDLATLKCQCPYGMYLDQSSSSCKNCISNCAICSNQISCIECSFNAVRDPLYPEQCIKQCSNDMYFDRIQNKCISCHINCARCSETSTNCTSCKSGAILANSNNSTQKCVCQNENDLYNEQYGTCQSCQDIRCLKCEKLNNTNNKQICRQCDSSSYLTNDYTCECKQKTYYSQEQQLCLPCKTSNCSTCNNPNGSTCTKCLPGYVLNNLENTCSYCNDGKYADENNNCILSCAQSQCEKCISSVKCDVFKEGAIFEGDDFCHYTCQRCLGNNQNQCVDCNPITHRIYDEQNHQCNCLSSQSYIHVQNQKICLYMPDTNILFQLASISTSAQYFIYLSTVLINIHPFSDYFIINSQLLGNFYYSQSSKYLGVFVNHFAKFNYFNLFDQDVSVIRQNMPSNENQSKLENMIPFFIYSFTCILASGIIYLTFKFSKSKLINDNHNNSTCLMQSALNNDLNITNSSKLNNNVTEQKNQLKKKKIQKIKDYLNWNLFIKAMRISSNLIITIVVNKYEEIFDSINPYLFCIIIYFSFYSSYLGYLIYFTFSKNVNTSFNSIKYLTDNLKLIFTLQRSLWLVTEIKKIGFCLMFLLNSYSYLWGQLSLCCLTLIILIIGKPFDTKRRDCLYLILSEFILMIIIMNLIILSINTPNLTSLQNVIKNQTQELNIIQFLQIIFSTSHTIFQIEYLFRMYYIGQQERILKESKNDNNKLFQQQIVSGNINFDQIQNILASRQMSIQLQDRKTFTKLQK